MKKHNNSKNLSGLGSAKTKTKAFSAAKSAASKGSLYQMLEHSSSFGGIIQTKINSNLPVMLVNQANQDYALIDSGYGFKLERFGHYKIIRPEGQALWRPRFSKTIWQGADAFFTGNLEEEGKGRWEFLQQPLPEEWLMSFQDISFWARFTSFRHVGIFPEQAPHWHFVEQQIKQAKRPLSVLNLFGYTGIASLIAARAGAQVTHIDASKKAILWAKHNQQQARLEQAPIRWICEDALKFVQREEKRGKSYDIILLDPPAYGRGPQGEKWQLFEDLPNLLKRCCNLLSPNAVSLILTAYSIRSSFYSFHNLMLEMLTPRQGVLTSGELIIEEEPHPSLPSRSLATSLYNRWQCQDFPYEKQ